MFTILNHYPTAKRILIACLPERALRPIRTLDALTKEKIQRRLEIETDRADFLTMLQHSGEDSGMTVEEMKSNFSFLIVADSETTATVLTGTTNYLLRNPEVLQRLTQEVRQKYSSEGEMTVASLSEIAYLTTVLEEGLRLCPPIPGSLPKMVPRGGAIVCGEYIPEHTAVAYHTRSAHQSAQHFLNPDAFDPTRWLKGPEQPSGAAALNAFGRGRFKCLGRKLAYGKMRLVCNFDIESTGTGEYALTDWKGQRVWSLIEKAPLMVRLVEARGSGGGGLKG